MCAGRYIHPEGLPSDYTISLLFRLLPDTPQEPFALWEVLNENNEPLVGVILDSESQPVFMFLDVIMTQNLQRRNREGFKMCLFDMLSLIVATDGGKTLTFFNNDYKGEFQTVTFEGPEIQKLFYGSFHKVRI